MPLSRRVFALGAAALPASLAGCSHRRTLAQGGPVRLGMVTDIGGLGDHSFNDSAGAGLELAQHALGAETTVLQSRSAADYQPNLTVLANKEYDEIFAVGFLMARDLDEVATRFPQRGFAIIDAVVAEPNVASLTFREQDGSFLAGAAAAMASKTKKVAFLGGVDLPLLRKFEAGYAGGVRQVDPHAEVLVKYIGSFDDVAAGREIAGVLFDERADVVYTAAGKAGLGAIEAVKARSGAYVIGVDADQDALAPGKILTSMIKRVDVGVLEIARRIVRAHAPPSGHIELGLGQDGVGLSDFRYTRGALTPVQFRSLDALRRAVVAGTIVPPATRDALAAFTPVPLPT